MATPVLVYATPEDLFVLGLNREACKSTPTPQIALVLDRASREMDGYFRNRYTLPFLEVDETLATCCCDIAAYRILKGRGFRPDGADQVYVQAYNKATAWLEKVANKTISPQVTDSSVGAIPGSSSAGRPRIATATDRGYSTRQGGSAYGPGWFKGD